MMKRFAPAFAAMLLVAAMAPAHAADLSGAQGTVDNIREADGEPSTRPDDWHDAAVQMGYLLNTAHMYNPQDHVYEKYSDLRRLGGEVRARFMDRFDDYRPRRLGESNRVVDIVRDEKNVPYLVFGTDRKPGDDGNPFVARYSPVEVRELAQKAESQPGLAVGILKYGNGNTDIQAELSTFRFIEPDSYGS